MLVKDSGKKSRFFVTVLLRMTINFGGYFRLSRLNIQLRIFAVKPSDPYFTYLLL
jgi:hypothetical protein